MSEEKNGRLADVDADTTTVYQDPRRGVVTDHVRNRVYVFSFPDREAAKKWATEMGVPLKLWDDTKKLLMVREPYLNLAFDLPRAPKDVLENL